MSRVLLVVPRPDIARLSEFEVTAAVDGSMLAIECHHCYDTPGILTNDGTVSSKDSPPTAAVNVVGSK